MDKLIVKFDENRLFVEANGGLFFKSFKVPISELLCLEERIIIRLKNLGEGGNSNRNVYCLNKKAEIVWQIQDPDDFLDDGEKTGCPFTGIKYVNGKLRAFNWCDCVYNVDIETGKISDPDYVR